ncbi:MAG: sulfite exporter TauE/SafE family protein [Betaproteobacteria bacterium]
MDIAYWLIYLGAGILVGFFAGLLGVGGGALMVPILSLTFASQGFSSDHVVHMALATSMATIVPGGVASAWAHHKHKAVNWQVVKQMAPGLLVGTFSGAVIAHFSSTVFLKTFFVGFICFLAAQLLFDLRPKSRHALPGTAGMITFGVVMGVISSFAGIGGAVLSIAFLTWCNFRMHDAIGTAAAIGVPLAIAGTVGFIVTGLFDNELPMWSLGYVYLPAFAGIAVTSIAIAPIGAKLAHRLPVAVLRRVFVVFLVVLAVKMAVSV